jgi:diguanylate cyclase
MLLVESTQRINTSLRKIDELCRFGGDEFIVVFKDTLHYSKFNTIFERIQKSFNTPIIAGGIEHYVSISIGIASYPQDAKNTEDLIKNADIAMYHAKEHGKQQHSFFETSLATKIKRQYEMEPRLKEALYSNQFELHYQPQMDTQDENIVSVEALIRWNHPEEGFILPWHFIDIIENGYMTKEFGEWVITTAAKQQKVLRQKGIDLGMSINLSVKHIMLPSFYEDIRTLVSKLDIDLSRFAFEIVTPN